MIEVNAALMRERREREAAARRLIEREPDHPGGDVGMDEGAGSPGEPGSPGPAGAPVCWDPEEEEEEQQEDPGDDLLGEDSERGSEDSAAEEEPEEEEEEEEEEQEEEQEEEEEMAGATRVGARVLKHMDEGWVRAQRGGLHICTGDAHPGSGEGVYCPNVGKIKSIKCGNRLTAEPKWFRDCPSHLKCFPCDTCQKLF